MAEKWQNFVVVTIPAHRGSIGYFANQEKSCLNRLRLGDDLMPDYLKVFTYELDGLSYTVSLFEDNGTIMADITVLEGAMDVNAIYFGDDDYSGESASLDGPLNMNGARLEDGDIQWDMAQALSDPGLGPDAADKETYLSAGDTLTLELDAESIDDIDVVGIRATSTTTDEGSIKAVSDDPEEPEEPEDPEEPTFEKVYFGTGTNEETGLPDGVAIFGEPFEGNPVLPEDQEPTFENYLAYFENEIEGYDITDIVDIRFYTLHEEGYPVELFRIEAPEGGFADADEVLEAYDAAIEAGALDLESGEELMAALSLPEDFEEAPLEEDPDVEDDLEMA
ncbi:hypothetical protein [Mameliella alba]|uniref:hypothetical protein n=2 Tax=Mameliella alba TaxID=561184 RepID=UPI0036D41E35